MRKSENNLPTLAIVVPCYNEEEVLKECFVELNLVLERLITAKKIKSGSYVLFVDDGSKDNTWNLIKRISDNSDGRVRELKLSRNYGHQMALLAGLSYIDTDICISIDADLQDDTECIPKMVEKYMQGNDIVYGVRKDRSSDSFFKKTSANLFYKFMSAMGVEQVSNHADYRLLSKKALSALLEFKERNIYIRGIIPLIGFRSDTVFYARKKRIAGKSKYPLKKMLSLAINGITSLSVIPLRMIAVLGFLTCLIVGLFSVYAIFRKISGETVTGWTSLILSNFFLGGVQLLCLGIIGEYIGKIYIESKQRPKFIIEDWISGKHND
ncbi:MAG: glycosyltransferase family 2 protein [Alphaproteobacteria bacterium]|nr:glycosyltransferase family 2 protein [Alphaproteobacteria bacterium]